MGAVIAMVASFILITSDGSDEALSEQALLARMAAAAIEAEIQCVLPGEVARMRSYLQAVQPAFDVISDPSDAKALAIALNSVRISMRKLGLRKWCELYQRERVEILRRRAVPPESRSGASGARELAFRAPMSAEAPGAVPWPDFNARADHLTG